MTLIRSMLAGSREIQAVSASRSKVRHTADRTPRGQVMGGRMASRRTYTAKKPPSKTSSVPVMYEASSEARSLIGSSVVWGGSGRPPSPPNVRRAPGEPEPSTTPRDVQGSGRSQDARHAARVASISEWGEAHHDPARFLDRGGMALQSAGEADRVNGIHDMGGMHGFGRVQPEKDEPVFHARWEARVLGLSRACSARNLFNIDESRHAIERRSE